MSRNKRSSEPNERLLLKKSLHGKIDLHIQQIMGFRTGVSVSRKDYLENLIQELPDELNSSEIKRLSEKFFDKEKFLRFLMAKIKESKKTGSEFDMAPYLTPDGNPPVRRKRKTQGSIPTCNWSSDKSCETQNPLDSSPPSEVPKPKEPSIKI